MDVVEKIACVLIEDDEAFPRRRAVACLVHWVKTRHPISSTILKLREPSSQETQGSAATEIKGMAVVDSEGKKEARIIVAQSIRHACQDFDWEVKLLGIQFLEAVTQYFIAHEDLGSSDREPIRSTSKEVNQLPHVPNLGQGSPQTRVKSATDPAERCLRVLHSIGACKILLDAVSDCDQMVCEEALLLLVKLKQSCFPEVESCHSQFETPEEIQESLLNCSALSLEKFKEILGVTDFTAVLHSSTAADNSVRSDPVSFLEDILTAARDHEQNLLDCY